MKPKVSEMFKGKHINDNNLNSNSNININSNNSNSNGNNSKNKYYKKEARPKSVNDKKLLKK
jgi:hypothetical protein